MQERYGGYGGRAKRFRVKPRFFVIIALLFGLAVWAIVALTSAFGSPKMEWGRLSSDQAISAIVVRDEQTVYADDVGRLSCVAAEGEAIAKNVPVVTLFLSGYSDKDNASLLTLQNNIKDYQKNQVIKDKVYADLTTINKHIDDKMDEISSAVIAHDTNGLAAAEQELKTLMAQRKQYMRDIIENPDETLTRYYEQEATLESKIALTRKDVMAPADGLVSFYLDGYETALTVNGISDMTPKKMQELLKKILNGSQPFKSADIVAPRQAIFRIVQPGKWYAVIVMNARENRFVQGVDCDVTFDGLRDTVTAKVMKVTTESGMAMAVLEVPEGAKELLSMRLVTGHLGQDIEGFRVPVNMVSEENGRTYVHLQGAGPNVTRIEVHILGRDERYAIIEEASGAGNLMIGKPLVKP
jgi:hypothetical protein